MTSDRGYRLDTTEEIISAEARAGEHWTGAVSKLGGIVRLTRIHRRTRMDGVKTAEWG